MSARHIKLLISKVLICHRAATTTGPVQPVRQRETCADGAADFAENECSRCELKRVKLMRQMRQRKRAVTLGLVALVESCSSIGDARVRLVLRRRR